MLAGKRILPAGRSVGVAQAVHQAGGEVQLVGKVGEDLAGDAIVLELGRRGIGHAALARAGSGLTPKGTIAPTDVDAEPDPRAPGADDGATDEEPAGQPALPEGLPLDAADLKVALGYLPDIGAIVVATPLADDAAKVVAEAAAYHDAPLVSVVEPSGRTPPAFANAIVLEASASEQSFDRLVGAFAVRLASGANASDALREVAAEAGWERSA